MKPSLPIQLPSIPDSSTSAEAWRQIAPILQKIAESERNDESLYPCEKIAYTSLAYAQYHASKKQWLTLWQYLLDRQVLRIGEIAAPPPKPPKRDRPTKPPKAKKLAAPKVAKPSKVEAPPKKRKRKSPIFVKFKELESAALRLQLFLWFADWVVTTAPKCRARSPIKNRPDGERIKTLLSYRADNGKYASLKLYLPTAKKRYRMNGKVLRILLDWSNPKRERTEAQIESCKAKGLAQRLITAEVLNQALTDKWQDTGAINAKLNALLDKPITLCQTTKMLYERARIGEVFQLKVHGQVYYSLVFAFDFETEWMNLSNAYIIAVHRGCNLAKNTFRKTDRINYAAYGLEFRKEVPEHENSLLRWRDIGF